MQAQLRAGVKGLVGGHEPCQLPKTPVLHQHGVHAPRAGLAQRLRRLGQLPIRQEGVEGKVDPDPVEMAVGHGVRKVFVCEIAGAAAGVEAAQSHVHGIGPVLHGSGQRLAGSGGSKQFHPYFLPCCALKSWRFKSETSFLAWVASSR